MMSRQRERQQRGAPSTHGGVRGRFGCVKMLELRVLRPNAGQYHRVRQSRHPDHLRESVCEWTMPVTAMTLVGSVVAFLVSKSLSPICEATGDVLMSAGPGQKASGHPEPQ
jgi:hypothetical protein